MSNAPILVAVCGVLMACSPAGDAPDTRAAVAPPAASARTAGADAAGKPAAAATPNTTTDAALAPGIAPGIYSNVQMSGETGDLGGIEFDLADGMASRSIDITVCEGWCNSVERARVRPAPGGGLYIDYPQQPSGDIHVMTIMPDEQGGVRLSVDWGPGVQTETLRRLNQPNGLQTARDTAADAVANPQRP